MDKNREEKRKLYLPKGVEARRMLFQGYGMKETMQSLILFLFFSPIAIIAFIFIRKTDILLFSLLGIALLSFSMCVKNQGLSIYEVGLRIASFHKKKQWFPYQSYDEKRRIEK